MAPDDDPSLPGKEFPDEEDEPKPRKHPYGSDR